MDVSHIPPSISPPSKCQHRREAVAQTISADPSIPQGESMALPTTPRDWVTQGPLSHMGHFYGWEPVTVLGNGTQSRLLCPLISLALANAAPTHRVPCSSIPQDFDGSSTTRTILVVQCSWHHQFSDRPISNTSECWNT